MSQIQKQQQLCLFPEYVQFPYAEEQELQSSIVIKNIVKKIVSYKIKTNKPGIYLVKPMQGKILHENSVVINFKRKELLLQHFNNIQANRGNTPEMFRLELTSEIQDEVGVVHKITQDKIIKVKFVKSNSQNDQKKNQIVWDEPSKSKKQKMQKKLSDQILQKKSELDKLIEKRKKLQQRQGSQQGQKFQMIDLINLLIVALVLGFLIG